MPQDVHDMSYYQKCMIGGILSCGITHTLVCPLDIVKCRKQVSPRSHNLLLSFYLIQYSNDLSFRQIPSSIKVFQMDSKLSTELKVSMASKL
jgi:hypothetical protein